MAKALFTSKGTVVEIGSEMGRGGEGSVFEVPLLGGQVAKLYHEQLDAGKQSKLTYMAATVDRQLSSYLAWPQETLHSSKGGPVVGFLMPKVAGKEPIHMVYSPAHRQQDHPRAAWDFLLFVARNIAACFEATHKHGYVIGDVNEKSVMAGADSKVILIDIDSFQINVNGTMHHCEVGVAQFTPPELQSLRSLTGFTRTTNHDNFGLALLIFHVLFGGRHPYSGVPRQSGVGDALETDIKNFRYAYARDGHTRGIGPPPRSIPLSMLPSAMETMFEAAFTESGAQGVRPTAQQWVAMLDNVRGRLCRCGASSMHVHPDHLTECPWCVLEQQGVTYFVDVGTAFVPTASGFILTAAWAVIQAVPAPPALKFPTPSNFVAIPQPLPPGLAAGANVGFFRALWVGIGILIAVAAPGAAFWGIVVGLVGCLMVGGSNSPELAAERRRRSVAQQAAKRDYEGLIERADREVGPAGYRAAVAELSRLRDEYLALASTEQKELDSLHATAQMRQKQKFLEGFFIESATIRGVGPTRKATLRSFGIETAADVSRGKVMQIYGFGDVVTRALLDWRASCERRYIFNPTKAVTATDQGLVSAKYRARRTKLESVLARGPQELKNYKQLSSARLAALLPALEASARNLAQTERDLSIF